MGKQLVAKSMGGTNRLVNNVKGNNMKNTSFQWLLRIIIIILILAIHIQQNLMIIVRVQIINSINCVQLCSVVFSCVQLCSIALFVLTISNNQNANFHCHHYVCNFMH